MAKPKIPEHAKTFFENPLQGSSGHDQNKLISIETKKSEVLLQSNAAILTPVVKNSVKNTKQLSKENSQTNLTSHRSGKNSQQVPGSQLRTSFELSSQIET